MLINEVAVINLNSNIGYDMQVIENIKLKIFNKKDYS